MPDPPAGQLVPGPAGRASPCHERPGVGDATRPIAHTLTDAAKGSTYPVPARRCRVEETVRRSRFITTLSRAETAEAAGEVIASIRREFPDATHNCWAFVAGSPGDTAHIGSSDDGEPGGSAGRPMLNVLLHSGVGEVAAVVTRYFGGTKLGIGGLMRAYAGGVKSALEDLPTELRVVRAPCVVVAAYGEISALQRIFADLDVVVADETYAATVRYELAVPEHALERLERAVADATRGSATFTRS